ncbi:heparan-alpha-glucosaminide N-acetyltransferase domain-containing protein [uncultured Parolsenella sp.]|uniref:heparan-alpha-glucosaminide N-acetyltransferase domain-containing protein n=1 Tax=uncultured Parolsenella sp. TaxID=2083008 RepID=UPI0025EB373D|nr:heparan-alpha-glucosaminide N-acetyltransferase domain-containing protein [uncultured Parolsenella sp.]
MVSSQHTASSQRVRGYDVLRGFSVVSMVAFHACYDIVYLWDVRLGWFRSPLQDVWRASISWCFLLIAGIMCSYSRNNLKRALKYLFVAAAIWIATTLIAVDTPISYGIIYCMGFSSLLAWALEILFHDNRDARSTKLDDRISRAKNGPKSKRLAIVAATLFLAFLLTLDVPQGKLGLSSFGGPYIELPSGLYTTEALNWLGFPGPSFASGDFYPPIPYSLLFLVGTTLGLITKLHGVPSILKKIHCTPLEWIGRHALEIYVVHQPIVLALLTLIFR